MPSQFDLTGSVALVTGGSSGIGRRMAGALATAGAKVVLVARRADKLADTQSEIEAAGGVVASVTADLMDKTVIDDLYKRAAEPFGAPTILVNGAGVNLREPWQDVTLESWDHQIHLNLSVPFFLSRACVPGMIDKGYGRIINIASAHGLTASPYKSAYVSAKHGLVGLTKTIALELAECGGTCNAICPGYVLTPLVEGQIPDQMKAHNMSREDVIKNVMLDRQPTKEFVTVEQMGTFAVFLASDMGAQITGAALPADGGWTAM